MTRILLFFVFALLTACADHPVKVHGSSDLNLVCRTDDSLIGSYEFTSGNERNDISIALSVTQEAAVFAIHFQAAHPDAHGAAPDGIGMGRVGTDGVLRFTYTDSFDNRGSGIFRRTAEGYALSITIDSINEPRCMVFYGDFLLHGL